MRMNGN